MAIFPESCLLVGGYGETPEPSVERIEMERGPAKQRVLNTQVTVEIACSVIFSSTDAVGDFDDWYFDTIKRVNWFTFQHPRTGATLQGRLKGGAIGTLVPINNARRRWKRDVVIEYLR